MALMFCRSLFILFSIVMFFPLLSASAFAQYRLPDLGNPSDTSLSPAKADAAGREVFEQLNRHGLVVQDLQLTQFVQKLGEMLARQTPAKADTFTFFVVNNDTVNAFALPGGYIGIHTGLIAATRNESELAAVMAHEIGHVTQHHIARQLAAQGNLNWATGAAVLAAIIAGGGSPEVVQGALGIGLASYYQNSVSFTRHNEMEADHVGIRTLAEAGFNPNGMVTFFQRLQEQTRLYGDQIPEILRTHPLSGTRIAEARERAGKYPKQHPAANLDYELMRARARILASNNAAGAVDHFRRLRTGGDHAPPATYGYALALERTGRTKPALNLFRELLTHNPSQTHYRLALAHTQINSGHADQALAVLKPALSRNHGNNAYLLLYANALLKAGKSRQARMVILRASDQLFDIPESHRLLSKAATRQDNPGEAYYQSAEYYRLKSDFDRAINHLRAGLRLPHLTDNQRARMRARLNTVKEQATKQRNNRDPSREREFGTLCATIHCAAE